MPGTLIFDIDGTLVPHGSQHHPSLEPCLQQCLDRGYRLLVATARRRQSGLARLGNLAELVQDGVYNNGACTWVAGRCIDHVPLAQADIDTAWELMQAYPDSSASSLALADERIAFSRPLLSSEALEWAVEPQDICSWQDTRDGQAIRLCAWSQGTDLTPLLEELQAACPNCEWQLVDRGTCLFGTAPGLTKQQAIQRYCQKHGIAAEDTIAFGDDLSDIGLLQWVGHGVAMADGHPEVLACADRQAPPSHVGGVATVLQELLELD